MSKIVFTPQATEDLTRLDRTISRRIIDKLEWLSQNIGDIKGEQ